MLLFHECLQLTKLWKYLFIIPWDVVLTSLYFWMNKWLNTTNASITRHAGDSIITLYLTIDALEQQAVPSRVRWMHVAQGGHWITAALQAVRTEGHRTTEAGRHFWDAHSKAQRAAHLHSPPGMETPQLDWPTCSTAPSNLLQCQIILTLKQSSSYIQMVFSVFQFVLRQWKWMHGQGEDR